MERTAIIVSGERGDCVVVGEDAGAVIGGSVVSFVVGIVVCIGSTAATTLNVFTPTYPLASLNVTSYSPGCFTVTCWVNSPAPSWV